ncbi:unnamed protein product [Protopolystoma xenopodis]|uniref:Uncharacterized protein n=1 Tax=Protopolystoma xenopodis TaxID=117903 RepID=A0A3S5B7F9_9PLAT|nr:unnamed protein product [Protopolystoma xenopodis]
MPEARSPWIRQAGGSRTGHSRSASSRWPRHSSRHDRDEAVGENKELKVGRSHSTVT